MYTPQLEGEWEKWGWEWRRDMGRLDCTTCGEVGRPWQTEVWTISWFLCYKMCCEYKMY